ncbi:MAG: (Fe-S)-binding protein [Negativicutes bacterium]|nr:(Fe-S)-binding protein [Negativicutes bacterium]
MSEPFKEFGAETEKCIRCGLCQKVCPIYAEMGSEPFVARGKVRLVKELIAGNLEISPRLKEILALCLDCGACTANCPPLVHTDKLVLAARAKITGEEGLPLPLKGALHGFLPNNSVQALVSKMAYFYQHSGMQKVLRQSGLLKTLSTDLSQKEGVMPNFAPRTFRSMLAELPRKQEGKLRVAYYLSCMTNMVNPALGQAVIKVLEQHDCQVIIPADVQCCGTPHLAYGDTEMATRIAESNARLLNEAQADVIVCDCATCGATLKKYDKLVPGLEGFGEKVFDIAEFLVNKVGLKAGEKPLQGVVTYHDPCHLARGQGVTSAPRQILKAIPGLTFVEMEESDRCCGGAGTFNVMHYDLSMKILDRKLGYIQKVNPAMVATGCPACRMQLEHGIARHELPIRVTHPVELLAQTY